MISVMSEKFLKSMLSVGEYLPTSQDGGRQPLEVTPERLKTWADTFAQMSANGLEIPVGWDHSKDPEKTIPLTKSQSRKRSARDRAGTMTGFTLAADGKSAEVELELVDEKAVRQAKGGIGELSPIIRPSWKDGRGRKYGEGFGHMDLVLNPVDNTQGRFRPAKTEDGLALAMALRFSTDDDFSADDTIVYRMADEDDEKKNRDGLAKDDVATTSENGSAPENNENPDMPKPESNDQHFEALIAHLSELGLVLPDDTDRENIVERLLTATMTANRQKSDAENDKEKDNESGNEMAEKSKVMSPEAGVATMSVEDRAAFDDLKSENERMKKARNRDRRLQLSVEIDDLTRNGQMTPDQAKAYKESLEVVQFSLDDEGEFEETTLDAKLDVHRNTPKGTYWSNDKKLAAARTVEPPTTRGVDEFVGETDADAERVADAVFGVEKETTAAAS